MQPILFHSKGFCLGRNISIRRQEASRTNNHPQLVSQLHHVGITVPPSRPQSVNNNLYGSKSVQNEIHYEISFYSYLRKSLILKTSDRRVKCARCLPMFCLYFDIH